MWPFMSNQFLASTSPMPGFSQRSILIASIRRPDCQASAMSLAACGVIVPACMPQPVGSRRALPASSAPRSLRRS